MGTFDDDIENTGTIIKPNYPWHYEYQVVRTHKATGLVEVVGFTHAILNRLDITENEWKAP
jgi:hypothetical protein